MRTVNLKHDRPNVPQALLRLDRELALARTDGATLLKIVHGYGSSGVGGEIRLAVQKRLTEMVDAGEIAACIFGEDWSSSDEQTWRLLQRQPDLKKDLDLGRGNRGITIVIFNRR